MKTMYKTIITFLSIVLFVRLLDLAYNIMTNLYFVALLIGSLTIMYKMYEEKFIETRD